MESECSGNMKNHSMKSESRNSLSTSTIFNLGSWLLPIVVGFISTPIILHRIGDKQYGIFMLILGFTSYSFTFNIGRAITRFISEDRAKENNESSWKIISATLLINAIIGSIGFIAISLAANYLVYNIFLIDESLQETAKLGFYIAGLTVLATMLSQVTSAILQGVHRFDIYSSITMASSVVLAIGNVVLVVLNQDISVLLLWNLFLVVLCGIGFWFFARRYFEVGKWIIDRATLKKVLHYSVGVTAYQIFGNLLLLFERTWITRNYGEENLTYYVVPMTLGIYVQALIASLTLAVFPVASEANAKNDTAKLLDIYRSTSKVVCAIVFFLCISGIASNRLFLTLYVGKNIAEKSADLLIIHLITFGLIAIAVVSWMLVEGVKNAKFNAFQSLLWLIIAVPAMILLSQDHQTYGVASGRLLGVLIVPITILIAEKWIFNKVLWTFWFKSLGGLIAASFVAYFVERWIFADSTDSWVRLILGSAFGFVGFSVTLLALQFFNKREVLWLTNGFK
jgi:O-antigen/teichoic acid export membrane protein